MDKKTTGIMFAIMAVSVFTAAILSLSIGIASKPSNIPLTVEPTDEIEELQHWAYNQGYNYTVSENGITHLSPEDRKALCGYKPLKAPEGNISENLRFVSDMPKAKAKAETEKFEQPPSYDALALGYVTPVKNQGACGSCWIFGAVADFESDVIINESQEFNFSEQEVGDCNIWSRVGGYNFCNGGNSFMTTNYFTKYGLAGEACHPYAATPQTCQNCSILKNVNNWRMITGSSGNELSYVNTIKDAILTYGPVYSTIYAGDIGFHNYSGGVYEYWGTESPNHAIEIIGWDDSLPHSQGTGAWMIKNSWGTDWGASGPYPGCAWIAYGAANLGDYTSAVSGYKTPDDVIFYHDECGWMGWCYGYGAITAYGAVRFIPSQDLTLTAGDFWTVDSNMEYEIMIFDTLNDLGGSSYSFSNQLGATQTGTTNESGYYSIPLNTPVQLVSGDDFIVQVKLATTEWEYPIPIDYCTEPWLPDWSGIATLSGESYCSNDGAQFTKPSPYDVGIRARAQAQVANATANPVRYMLESVKSGEDFNVTVTWTAPADNFNAIGLTDNANATANMTVSGNTGWCSPNANFSNNVNNTIGYIWFGPYSNGTDFTAVYSVHVPIDVPEGNYAFDGYLEYYSGGEGPFIEDVTGDSIIKVIKGLSISGLTGEVNCSIEPNVTITLYNKTTGNKVAEATSDINGNYTISAPGLGEYKVNSSKAGFKNVTREISITEEVTYTLNFSGEYGLIPEDPSMGYALECVNHWLYPPDECGLSMSKVLEVVNAWLY